MSKFKFKIGQKVKIIDIYPSYDNVVGTIIHRFCCFNYNYYHINLDNKKIDDSAIICERKLVLANGNLITNE